MSTSNVLQFGTNTSFLDIPYTTVNPLSNLPPSSSGTWCYYLLQYPTNTTIQMSVTPGLITNLYMVSISPGGCGGQSYQTTITDPENPNNSTNPFPPVYTGGGGGGGGVSVSSFNVKKGANFTITFGGINSLATNSANPPDTTIQMNGGNYTKISPGVGYNGGNTSEYSTTTFVYKGGNGGDGANNPTTTVTGAGGTATIYGGSGGNGGTGYVYTYNHRGPLYTLQDGTTLYGIPGTNFNGATYANPHTYQGIGTQPPAYTPITMADGTSANVATAGQQNQSGNMSQVLVYYSYP
jgi:hypothetical protein